MFSDDRTETDKTYFLGDITTVKKKLQRFIIDELDEKSAKKLSPERVRQVAQSKIREIADEEGVPLSSATREKLMQEVLDEIFGLGPIEEFMRDPEITEVMVNGPDEVYIEKHGKIYRTDARFLDDEHLLKIIDRIVSQVGRRIDEASPMVDARLPDGSRVNAAIHPVAVNGPFLTIRKFLREIFTPDDLIRLGSVTQPVIDFLRSCVEGRLNIVVSGGTGTGKTTLLNILSNFIPNDERIVTIEDSVELQLQQEHVLRMEARPPNIEGKGEITIRDLVRNALRMRPDRIIVGEVRGAEAIDMLQAMNTGHDGSLTTLHANSPRDALARIETMVMMAGMELTLKAIRGQMASAIDLIIHLARLKDGSRKIVSIVEVQGMEGDVITLSELFLFDYGMGVDEQGRFKGWLKSTGIRPKFLEKLANFNITVPSEVFEPEIFENSTGYRHEIY